MGQQFFMRMGVALILGLTLLSGAMAASKAPALAVGVIDYDAVMKTYVGYEKAMGRFQAFAKEREEVFLALKGGLGLSAKEFDEYLRLAGHAVKVNPVRIKELEELARKNMAELKGLQGKEPLTDAERTKLDGLDAQVKSATELLQNEGGRLSREIQEESSRYFKLLIDQIDKSIAKVAETKKVAMVVSRNVQVGENTERFVLWGGTDLTADVTKILNDEFKENIFDQKK
jgi:Skp family chaperone for outer membrane proteins